MTESFRPPGLASLADVDVADADYGTELVVVDGVVAPGSQGGWRGENDGYKVHSLSLSAWRRPGEPIVRRELVVLRPVPPDADYFDDIPELSLQRFRLLLSTDESRAVLEAVVEGNAPDAELQAIAEELARPVVVPVEPFGDLHLEREYGWFKGEPTWKGASVRLTIEVGEGNEPNPNAIGAARKLWSDQAVWNSRVEAYAVVELLDLKNETWLTDGEPPLDADAFVERIQLKTIAVDEDGAFEFWFDDGDLFWGHSILVDGNLEEGPTNADIPG